MPAPELPRGALPAGAALAASLVGFAELLRSLGIRVGTVELETAVRGLAAIDPADREDAYWALRCALIADRRHAEEFDRAFAAFWDGVALAPLPEQPPTGPGADVEEAPGRADEGSAGLASPAEGDPGEAEGDDVAGAGVRFSREERLRELDFRAYGTDDLAQANRMIRELGRRMPERLSRRLEKARHGRSIDRRATLRLAMRTEGHPLQLARRRTRLVHRRLVFAIDVSGSMEEYARPLFVFAQAACRASRRVEVFAFGTRLTRLTRELGAPDAELALARAAAAIPDWAGGTRIGDNLRRLNDEWGGRGVTRGAAVVIFSDGWERGGVETLREEVQRLHRAAHTLVWVNPLAGDPGYEPLAAGMAAALDHVDVFLPAHNLRSLEALASVLAEIPGRGGRARSSPARAQGKTRHG